MNIDMDPLQKQMLDDVFDAFTMLTDGNIVSLMHVKAGVTRYTTSAVELFGFPGEYIPNGAMDFAEWVHPEDRQRYLDAMSLLIPGDSQTYDLTYRVRTVSGEYINFRAVGAVLRGEDGLPNLIGGAMFNEGMMHTVDPVTALPNKVAFRRDLVEAIRERKDTYALMIGINQFSEVNRTRGYTYGNRVLQEVAWLMQEALGERGKVYYWENGIFTVLGDELERKDMAAIYDYLSYQLQRGVEVNGETNVLRSGGGLISTVGSETNADTMITCLEFAYNESQARMNGDLVDFNGNVHYEREEAIEILQAIHEAAAHGCEGFHLEYLPVISAQNAHVNGAEALIYWEDEQFGKVEAEDFMPVLERDFVFEEIGDFILKQGLADGARFLEHDPAFLLCLNVRRAQLDTDYFVDNLLYYLDETGFDPTRLSFKLDSDCRYIGPERMRTILDKLHERGILVVIGDFGSGADSIGFLKAEPVDAVSIGEQFVEGVKDSPEDLSTLTHLAQMASNYVEHINLKGIDDDDLLAIARTLPISTVQGTRYSDPLDFDSFVARYYR